MKFNSLQAIRPRRVSAHLSLIALYPVRSYVMFPAKSCSDSLAETRTGVMANYEDSLAIS